MGNNEWKHKPHGHRNSEEDDKKSSRRNKPPTKLTESDERGMWARGEKEANKKAKQKAAAAAAKAKAEKAAKKAKAEKAAWDKLNDEITLSAGRIPRHMVKTKPKPKAKPFNQKEADAKKAKNKATWEQMKKDRPKKKSTKSVAYRVKQYR